MTLFYSILLSSFSLLQGANQQASCEGDREGVFSALSGTAGGRILNYLTKLEANGLFSLSEKVTKTKNTNLNLFQWLMVPSRPFYLGRWTNKNCTIWTEPKPKHRLGRLFFGWVEPLCNMFCNKNLLPVLKQKKMKEKVLNCLLVSAGVDTRGSKPLLPLTKTPINHLFFAAAWATVCECSLIYCFSSVVYCL